MFETSFKRRGFMFVLSSPSGAGKTTLSRLLMQNDERLVMSVSCTTREKRKNEEEGKDYFFLSEQDFQKKVQTSYFYEHAKVFGKNYGTPKAFVENVLVEGKDVLFDIDWQGTRRLTETARADIVSVFILPPSLAELKRRLIARDQDSEAIIEQRMERALDEISHWDKYDYVIVNDSIESSLQKILYILQAERLKRSRQHGLGDFVATL